MAKRLKKLETKRKPTAKAKTKPKTNALENPHQRLIDAGKKYWFRPGQVSNPKGRPPKSKTFSDILRNQLEFAASSIPIIAKKARTLKLNPKLVKIKDVIAAELLVKAIGDDRPAYLQELFNRVDGKVAEIVEAHVRRHLESVDKAALLEVIREHVKK